MNKRFHMIGLFFAALLIVSLSVASLPVQAQGDPTGPIGLDHPFAAFLESRAYGVQMGATAELRKMEGTIIDEANRLIYIAFTEILGPMADTEGNLQFPENACGAVYVGELDEAYNVTSIRPLVVGGPFNAEARTCADESISNPDNLAVDAAGNLWIGEDTSLHGNNMVWRFSPTTGELLRFATLPRGSEATGLAISANGTMFLNIQHPRATNVFPFNRATIGVVTGFNPTDTFTSIDVPSGNDRLVARVAAGEYQILGRVGETIPGDPMGLSFGQVTRVDGSTMFFCNDPDGNMFLPVGDGTEGYLYSNYECRPGGLSRIYIRQDEAGMWEVVEGGMVDFSSVNGTWNNCFASVTPWNTALTAEEYEAIAAEPAQVEPMTEYLGRTANPYDYGWIVELSPQAVGNNVAKRYAMGRKSNENAWVAGDRRTVYFGDDGSGVMMFKFVATEEGDLSAGTLFAATLTVSGDAADPMGHQIDFTWVELGTANDDDIAAAIRAMDVE